MRIAIAGIIAQGAASATRGWRAATMLRSSDFTADADLVDLLLRKRRQAGEGRVEAERGPEPTLVVQHRCDLVRRKDNAANIAGSGRQCGLTRTGGSISFSCRQTTIPRSCATVSAARPMKSLPGKGEIRPDEFLSIKPEYCARVVLESRRYSSRDPLYRAASDACDCRRVGAPVMLSLLAPDAGRTRTALDAADFGTEAADPLSPRA